MSSRSLMCKSGKIPTPLNFSIGFLSIFEISYDSVSHFQFFQSNKQGTIFVLESNAPGGTFFQYHSTFSCRILKTPSNSVTKLNHFLFVPQPCQMSFLGPDEILHFGARKVLHFGLHIQLVLNHKLNQILT